MKLFTSFLSMQMEEFIRYRKAAGNWNGSYEENLKLFDVYVARNFPDSMFYHRIWQTAGVQKGRPKQTIPAVPAFM